MVLITMIRRILPTAYLLIALIIMLVLHFIIPILMLITVPWNLIGIIPLIIGILVNLLADAALHKGGTTVQPFQESAALITNGVYGISRNPMYLGFVLVLIGVAILLRSLSPWIVIPLFIILVEFVFITEEEKMLAEKFGPIWIEYRKKVRQWI
jgi:protein-S-isoprenylcysteine O-methyltransferase Ste14